ncbi:MAG: hypothetical protein U0S36_08700 [Candidatus Nanopelagicales bacterium]
MAGGRGQRGAAWLCGGAVVVAAASGCSGGSTQAVPSPAQDYRAAMELLVAQGVCADPQYTGDGGGAAAATCRTGSGELLDSSPGTGPVTVVGDAAGTRLVRGPTWTVTAPSPELAQRAAAATGGTVQAG